MLIAAHRSHGMPPNVRSFLHLIIATVVALLVPSIQNKKGLSGMQAATETANEEAAAVQTFDHFMGNDAGAFVFGEYDEDDREADEVWDKIEDTMDERRKVCTGSSTGQSSCMRADAGSSFLHQWTCMYVCGRISVVSSRTLKIPLFIQRITLDSF